MKNWMRRTLLLVLALTLASCPGWGVMEETELPEETGTEPTTEATEVVTEVPEEIEEVEEIEIPEVEPAEETEELTELPEALDPEIYVLCEPDVVTALGESVRLTAAVAGADGCELTFLWQYNVGAGFQDAKGADGEICVFEATEELIEADWRLTVTYESTAENGDKGTLTKDFRIASAIPEEETLVGFEEKTEEQTEVGIETEAPEELLEEEELIPEADELVPEVEEPAPETEELPAEEEIVEESFIPAEPTVSLSWNARDIMRPDEIVTIFATVTNAEYYDLTFQWQCDLGDGFKDVPDASGDTYSFPATAELLSAQWQVLVHYELKAN